MDDRKRVRRVLLRHFFRRFFDNDSVQVEGDTQTAVIRALSAVAVPGLMVAFWLQTSYPGRTPEGAIHDQYFFVLQSLVVMGVVALFEWEMLFPDKLDFLVLSPLALKPREMLGAKAKALGIFLGMFLVAVNLFGLGMYPLVSSGGLGRVFVAQAAATLMAGTFGVLVFLALGGVMLCALNTAQFRMVSPVVQMLAVCVLVLLAFHYVLMGERLAAQLNASAGLVRWMPTVWFLGMYERVLHGNAALPFASEMSRRGVEATLIAGVVATVTYPLAWTRMRRMAIEGSSGRGRRGWRGGERLMQLVVRRPAERAMFAFIGQTMARNQKYQVYLAMYCGVGLALAIACSVGYRVHAGQMQWSVSKDGLHMVTPLMMFWVITGLRAAFGLPVNLQAGWVFRVTGVKLRECAAAARSWAMMCAVVVLACILGTLWLLGWGAWPLVVQAGTGLCVALLLTNAFFAEPDAVPFNRPRMPGKSQWALLLTLYFGVLPAFVFVMSDIEKSIEKKWMRAVGWCVVTSAAWGLMVWRRRKSPPLDDDWAEYSGEFLLLGLGQR